MNKLYEEISLKLVKSIELYMENKITLQELKEIEMEERLLLENWSVLKTQLRDEISGYMKTLHTELANIDKDIKTLEKLNTHDERDIDLENISTHALLLGRNRSPSSSEVGSEWYVGPYPTIQMLSSFTNEEETSENTKK